MTTTDILAWIGAFTGTAALFWDIYKWKSDGVCLHVEAITFGFIPPEGITFKVCNRGGKATTLTEIWLTIPHKNWLLRLFSLFQTRERLFSEKKSKVKLPTLIQPGEIWTADYTFVPADQQFNVIDYPELIASRSLSYRIKCSHSNRCLRGLVKSRNQFLFS